MDYPALKMEAVTYRGALMSEALMSGRRLRALERWLRSIAVISLTAWLALFFAATVPFFADSFPAFSLAASPLASLAQAAFLALLGLWIPSTLWRGFSASFYFKDVDAALPESGMRVPKVSYAVASVVSGGAGDPLLDFLTSSFGAATFRRLGIDPKELVGFLKNRAAPAQPFEVATAESEQPIDLGEFAKALLAYDEGFARFLAAQKADATDFIGAAEWVSRIERQYKTHLRWWGRDQLGRIPGIGKDWAYGETALLQKYATEIGLLPSPASVGGNLGVREADEIERILSRGREANVLLVGEEGVPLLSPLSRLARRIRAGTVLPPLEHKRIFVLDGAPFVSALKEKLALETELTRLMGEAVRAGNIIFVFDHFDTLCEEAKILNSDALSLLDPYLSSASIQIVAICELGAFRRLLEPNPRVRERFERVLFEGATVQSSIPVLEEEALRAEASAGVLFTYQAVRAVAEAAERYFFEGVMPDKAIDLLHELVPSMRAAKKRLVTKDAVLELVSRKTGIAAAEATGEERARLLRLEEILHERIVGQEEAVRAISNALRRARSGISSPQRPLGSFLFLGPTGVGKTETTKALAQVFFGDEKTITRLDMSEYRGGDALGRLIGTFESGKPGVLASLLREHPYGVLLLDEFEKTSKEVHDLFLQILDEGFFSDVSGKRVSARNLMIIATSNAASDVIWNMKHGTPEKDKDAIITEIINRGIFKPELLNRFDGVILFHPLEASHLRSIARLMLERLGKRLAEKGLELVITDALLNYLVSVGQDPKFGARPMNRAIQEKVEQVIAEKMLRGELAAGSRVELSPADFG